jgi:hypothetical protein
MNSELWIEMLALPTGLQPDWAAAESALRTNGQLADDAERGDRAFDREDLCAAIAIARGAMEDGTVERFSFNGLTIYLTWEYDWACSDISVCGAFDLLKESGFAQIIGFAAQTDETTPAGAAHR